MGQQPHNNQVLLGVFPCLHVFQSQHLPHAMAGSCMGRDEGAQHGVGRGSVGRELKPVLSAQVL